MSVGLADDRKSAVLTLLPASGVEGAVVLSLEQLSELIQALGTVRAALVAQTPQPPLEGAQLKAAFDPRWLISPEALTEGSMLAFQHPHYGPVAFVLPRREVEKVVRLLTNHLNIVHAPEGARPS
jgi:hypothetical protein